MEGNCLWCEKKFTVPKNHRKKKFCSLVCSGKYYYEKHGKRSGLHKRHVKRQIIEKICERCNKEFIPPKRNPKKRFCSYLCSNGKKCSKEHKEKTSQSLKKYHKENKKQLIPYTKVKINQCELCSRMFWWKKYSTRKYCSNNCFLKAHSERRKKYLRDNAGTFNWISNANPTYFEQNLKEHLESFGLIEDKDFIFLRYIVYHQSLDTSYIMDFYFPDLKINIETDGTHHEKLKQAERDRKRDKFLNSSGIKVFRISIRDYNKKNNRKTVLNQVKTLLNVW